MPIKLLGAAAIILAGTLWGVKKSSLLLKRENSLKNILTALGMLESEVVFSSHKLKTAFLNISKLAPCEGLFSEAAKNLSSRSALKAWNDAADFAAERLCLNKKDLETVKLLGSEIGMSDKEQQLRNLRRIEKLLEVCVEEAHTEYISSAKMYRSLGLFAGLFVAVLLM